MAEKGTKKKKGKGEANVLGSLPATRPNRLGRHARQARRPRPAADRAKPRRPPGRSAAAKPAKPKAKRPAPRPLRRSRRPVAKAAPARPKPVRAASAKLDAPARQSDAKRAPARADKPPSGTELVTTVVQAAGELASVGFSIGGQIVKRAVERLPKP